MKQRTFWACLVALALASVGSIALAFTLEIKVIGPVHPATTATIRSVSMALDFMNGFQDAGAATITSNFCNFQPCITPDAGQLWWTCTVPCNFVGQGLTALADSNVDGGLAQCSIVQSKMPAGTYWLTEYMTPINAVCPLSVQVHQDNQDNASP